MAPDIVSERFVEDLILKLRRRLVVVERRSRVFDHSFASKGRLLVLEPQRWRQFLHYAWWSQKPVSRTSNSCWRPFDW
jgi:hypothetical protein